MAFNNATPSFIGFWKALRREINPCPPASLLMTAVATGFLQIVGPFGGTARIDEADTTHVAVRHLVTAQVNGVVGGKLGVYALVDFTVAAVAHLHGGIARRCSRAVSV